MSEPVDLALSMAGTEGSVVDDVRQVPALEAGEQTTVEFGELAVVPGERYELTVRLPVVAAESENEDNTRSIGFSIRRILSPSRGSCFRRR